MRKLVAVSLLPLFLGVLALAAQPYNPTRNNNLKNAVYTRIVTVDSTGRSGDFKDLSDALSYVANRPDRGAFTRYLVIINPGIGDSTSATTGGNFTESTLTIPSFTVVQGAAAAIDPGNSYSGLPVINLTGTTGALITLNSNSALVNLVFKMPATTLTGNTTLLNPVAPSFATNIGIKAISVVEGSFTLDLLGATGAFIGHNVSTWRSGSAANTRNVVTTGSGSIALYGGRHIPGTSQAKLIEAASSSTLSLYGVRVDAGATVTLTRTSGTLSVFQGTIYDTSSGTVTDPALRASSVTYSQGPKDLVGAGAPEGVVTAPVGSTYRRTDGGAGTSFCVKESGTGNTGWVCK